MANRAAEPDDQQHRAALPKQDHKGRDQVVEQAQPGRAEGRRRQAAQQRDAHGPNPGAVPQDPEHRAEQGKAESGDEAEAAPAGAERHRPRPNGYRGSCAHRERNLRCVDDG